MGCPSLLFLTPCESRTPFASDSVFTDLMLRDTLPESVLRVLQWGAEPQEISARQEIFRLLDTDTGLAASFEALSQSAEKIARLTKLYER